MDLIERQKAIDAPFKKWDVKTGVTWIPLEHIEQLPSAQPEIIHCKDCRHNGSFDTDCPIDWNGKEYCSFAER